MDRECVSGNLLQSAKTKTERTSRSEELTLPNALIFFTLFGILNRSAAAAGENSSGKIALVLRSKEMANLGAFRVTRVLLDGRNRFSKVIKISQTQKRNTRKRIKIVQENAAIIREGKEALDRVNARIIAEHRAAAQQGAALSAVKQKQKN